jgi:formamidopyrimidine-DNA glycosylase
MFELPEFITLARQMNSVLPGKIIRCGNLGNTPHKFVWYNRSAEEFAQLTKGRRVGRALAKGKWLTLDLEPGYRLLLGECGGRVLLHPPGAQTPAKFHLRIAFEDDYVLTATTQMWGAMELYELGKEQERQYIKEMRPTPIDPGFTFEYFSALIDSLAGEKRSAKSLLTQDQLIPGLGNAIAQEILFTARLHPKHPIHALTAQQERALFTAIVTTVREVIDQGGRNDEHDLFDQPGGYVRRMDSSTVGQPCPACGSMIQKIQYLGGACYFCPQCQQLE